MPKTFNEYIEEFAAWSESNEYNKIILECKQYNMAHSIGSLHHESSVYTELTMRPHPIRKIIDAFKKLIDVFKKLLARIIYGTPAYEKLANKIRKIAKSNPQISPQVKTEITNIVKSEISQMENELYKTHNFLIKFKPSHDNASNPLVSLMNMGRDGFETDDFEDGADAETLCGSLEAVINSSVVLKVFASGPRGYIDKSWILLNGENVDDLRKTIKHALGVETMNARKAIDSFGNKRDTYSSFVTGTIRIDTSTIQKIISVLDEMLGLLEGPSNDSTSIDDLQYLYKSVLKSMAVYKAIYNFKTNACSKILQVLQNSSKGV